MHLIGWEDAKLPQGRLHLWRMDEAARQAARPHPNPPAAIQRARLEAAIAQRAVGESSVRWGAVCFELPGPPRLDALTSALTAFARRHDTLHSGFTEDARLVVPADLITLHRTEPDPVADVSLALAQHFDQATDPFAWPAYAFAAIEEPGRLTVLLAFDHLHSDLYTLAIAADEVALRYTEPSPALPAAGSHLEFSRAEHADRLDQAKVTAWRSFVADCGGTLPSSGLELGVAPGERVPLVHRELPLLDAAGSAVLDEWSRATKTSVFTGLLAALAGASAQLTGVGVYRTLLALQTRPVEAQSAVGWFVTAAPISIPVSDELATMLASAQRAALSAHRFVSTPVDSVLEQMPEAAGEKVSWLSYMDFRPLVTASPPGRNARIVASHRAGNDADLWLNRTHEGILLYCRYPDTPTAHKTIAHLVELTSATLDRLRPATGG